MNINFDLVPEAIGKFHTICNKNYFYGKEMVSFCTDYALISGHTEGN
jgi:hypothetical protein